MNDPREVKNAQRGQTEKIDTLVVAGCGLLGTSVARAVRRVYPHAAILGVEPDPQARAAAANLRVYDQLFGSVAEAAASLAPCTSGAGETAGRVVSVAATPPSHIAQALVLLAPFSELVMDVGSMKGAVISDLIKVAEASGATAVPANIVPCHPMAGSHESGPAAGVAELFDNRWVFVVPVTTSEPTLVAAAHRFWQSLGASTQELEPAPHDEAVAYTSHLPHLLASAYMEVQVPQRAAAGTGFMAFTRLAKANPEMWSQVLVANRTAWQPLLRRYIEVLERAEVLLESGDTKGVERWLEARLAERLNVEPAFEPEQER